MLFFVKNEGIIYGKAKQARQKNVSVICCVIVWIRNSKKGTGMKKRKCIGVFLGQPDLPFQTQLLSAVGRRAFQENCDVAVFSSMVHSGGYLDYQDGEARILELVNFEKLDAVIVAPDTLQLKENFADMVLEFIRQKFRGIKVVIDAEAEGYHSFLCDDRAGILKLVRHLIEEHSCRDIAFMTGPEQHPHSRNRLAGYRQALEDAGIQYDESRVFYGDFWYYEGERVVQELAASEKGMPQAIACASDIMAISVCEALGKRGLRVPEDVLVTGFDCDGNGISREHFITSSVRDIDLAAEKAVCYIMEQLGEAGCQPEKHKESGLLLTHSCGCQRKQAGHAAETGGLPDVGFFSLYNFMTEKLISVKDLKECIWSIDWYADQIGEYDRMYLCLCTDWNREEKGEDFAGFSDRLILALDKKRGNDEKHEERVNFERIFSREEMLPALWEDREQPKIFYFNVLHFGKHCFGYIVLEYDGSEYVYDKRYPFWVRNVNNALESLRRLYAVQDMYKAAEQKAITDIMTGLYNRNGYNIFLGEVVEQLGEDEKLLFMLFDNNGLKYINDTYGHVAGDEVICFSTKILAQRYFGEGITELNFRIGGDEYVKLAYGRITDEMVQECVESIRRQLKEANEEKSRPYPIYLALGYRLYSKSEIESKDQIMKEADARMYENKLALKKVSGFHPERKA